MGRKIGFTLIILQIFALVAVQLALSAETVREAFTPIDRIEGTSTAAIIDNVGTVEVELSVENFRPNELRILVNGKLAGVFGAQTARLAVRGNSLIEIDATDEETPFAVRVSDISDNAMDISRSLSVVANRNIAILGKIYVL